MGMLSCVGCNGFSGSSTVRSTEKREKLESSLVDYNNDWYEDDLGWIDHKSTLINGLEHFYEKTGVQPFLCLVDSDGTMNDEEQEAYAEAKYDELFDKEGHFLVCYFSCEGDNPDLVEGDVYYLVGKSAETVLDTEAKEIFDANWAHYYDVSGLTIEEFFAKTFSASGDAIMQGPIHMRYVVIIIVAIIAAVIIVVLLIKWWKARTKQKNKEQEDLERILDKPLETFGDEGINDLKDKYDK